MRYCHAAVLLVTLLLPLQGGCGAQQAAGAPGQPSDAARAMVGTVRSVDYSSGTVELLTGYGPAMWVERLRVPSTLQVTIDGRPRPLADLRRGWVLRAEYRETERGKDVTSLIVVPVGGGAR